MDIKPTDSYTPRADVKPVEPNQHEQSPPGPFRMDIKPTDPEATHADYKSIEPNRSRIQIVPPDPNGIGSDAPPIPYNSEGIPPGPYRSVEQIPPGPFSTLYSEIMPPGPSKAALK